MTITAGALFGILVSENSKV